MLRLFMIIVFAFPLVAGEDWELKVDPILLNGPPGQTQPFILYFHDQADLSHARLLPGKEAKGWFVYETLKQKADATQKPVIAELEALDANYQSFWIANMILVEGDEDLLINLAQRNEIARIFPNPLIENDLPQTEPATPNHSPNAIEWGVELTGAPAVWDMGYRGQGVVIGGQDTGYNWNHEALIHQYRGWDGVAVDHNYNWHDAIHSGFSSCGVNLTEPCDDNSHGTHTMGTALGDDGAGNQIGMAPDAQWIGCRNMGSGNGTPTTYSECFQWFVAPTDLTGKSADPGRAPHVLINSWGCPPSEGCTDPLVLETVVNNTRAAGIVVVVSAGNAGPSCSSIVDPPAIYEGGFAVGSTRSNDAISSFSSRGAITIDGSGRLKPDISAPGSGIRSAVPGGYGSKSGTSMAGPHVSGLVALIISAVPELAGNVDAIEEIIRQTALPLTSTQNCNGFDGSLVPNAVFGYGRIRALDAVLEATGKTPLTCEDYPIMLSTWPGAMSQPQDVNGNGVIDLLDLMAMLTCPL